MSTTSTRTNSDDYGEQDYKTTVKVRRSQADKIQEISGHAPAHELIDELLALYETTRSLQNRGGR